MQPAWANSRFLLFFVVIVMLLVSMPEARAADESVRKADLLNKGARAFILKPARLDFSQAAGQRKSLGVPGGAIFQVGDNGNGFGLNSLDLPFILARGNSPVAHTSRAKPVPSPRQRRFKPDDGLLTVAPGTIDFGSVPVGSYENQMGTLVASDSEVTISSATISDPEFTLSGLSFPLTIPAGGHRDYTVEFTPQAAGAASATLSFATDGNSLATQNLTGIGGDQPAHTVDLSWNGSTSPDVIGYNIYRGTTSGGPYAKINFVLDLTTSYTDTAVSEGNTYYYVTTAIDGNGQESTYSNEVQAAIP